MFLQEVHHIFKNAVSHDECDHICSLAHAEELKRAEVQDGDSKHRSSMVTWINDNQVVDIITKKIASYLANSIRKKILNDDCDDTGCGLKVFDKQVCLNLPFFNGIHRFLPALFKASNLNISYIEVDHRKRYMGYSKYGNFKRFLWGIRDIIKVMKIIKRIKSNE